MSSEIICLISFSIDFLYQVVYRLFSGMSPRNGDSTKRFRRQMILISISKKSSLIKNLWDGHVWVRWDKKSRYSDLELVNPWTPQVHMQTFYKIEKVMIPDCSYPSLKTSCWLPIQNFLVSLKRVDCLNFSDREAQLSLSGQTSNAYLKRYWQNSTFV